MNNFRIVKFPNKYSYRIQKRFLWFFWRDYSFWYRPYSYGTPYKKVVEFGTAQIAEDALRHYQEACYYKGVHIDSYVYNQRVFFKARDSYHYEVAVETIEEMKCIIDLWETPKVIKNLKI